MINFDDYANENKTEHNWKWPYIPDHPYRILIIGGSRSGKTCIIKFNKQPARYWPYSACGPFTKNKQLKNLKKQVTQNIFTEINLIKLVFSMIWLMKILEI